jgi:hypothetical protein
LPFDVGAYVFGGSVIVIVQVDHGEQAKVSCSAQAGWSVGVVGL